MSYHDHPALSRSAIKTFRDEGRRMFHARHVLRLPEAQVKVTRAMNLGTLVHAELLEPGTLDSKLVVRPDCYPDYKTKAAREWRDAQIADGRIILLPGETDATSEMVKSLAGIVGDYITNNVVHIEHEVYWRDPVSHLECRCKPDLLVPRSETMYCFDVKTTEDASPHGFRKAAIGQGYFLQQLHYSLGIQAEFKKPVMFFFVVVEREYPYRAGLYELDLSPDAIAEYRRTLDAIRACYDSDDWREPWEPTINRIEVGGYSLRSDSVPANPVPSEIGV